MYCWKVKDIWDDEHIFDDFEDMLDFVFDYERYEDSDETVDYINDEYGYIDINGHAYSAAEILESFNSDDYYAIQDQLAQEKAERKKEQYKEYLRTLEPGKAIEIEQFTIERVIDEESEPDVSVDDLMGLIHNSVL